MKTTELITRTEAAANELQMSLNSKNYNASNAMKYAAMLIKQTKDKNGKSALEVCSQPSIIGSVMKMIFKKLDPVKDECYFVIYAGQLTLIPSYFGNVKEAKDNGMKDYQARVVYKNDKFAHHFEAGKLVIDRHTSCFENIDNNNILGAYCITESVTGKTHGVIMSRDQIQKAWEMSPMKGDSKAHNNFTDEMCLKTVISRACKHYKSEDVVDYQTELKGTINQGFIHIKDEQQKAIQESYTTEAPPNVTSEPEPEQNQNEQQKEKQDQQKPESPKAANNNPDDLPF